MYIQGTLSMIQIQFSAMKVINANHYIIGIIHNNFSCWHNQPKHNEH